VITSSTGVFTPANSTPDRRRDPKGYGKPRFNRSGDFNYAPTVDPAEPVARTRHGELTLRQLAEALPGTGELMRSVGHAFGMAWHAANGGNWDLSAYYIRRTLSLLRGLAVVRPKYAGQIAEFNVGWLEPTYQAIIARDLGAFEQEYARCVDQANEYHVTTGHPYIRWRTPANPPDQALDLGP